MKKKDFQEKIDSLKTNKPYVLLTKTEQVGFFFKRDRIVQYRYDLPSSIIDGYGSFILNSFKGFEADKPKVHYKTAPEESDLFETSSERILYQSESSDSLYSLSSEEQPNPYRYQTVKEDNSRYKRDIKYVIEETKNTPTFSDLLIKTQNMLGLKAPEVYKAAGIDYRHYSKIISDKNYKPKKETVFALAIALKLNDYAAEQFLLHAGYSFNPSDLFDMTIKYFIEEEIYDRVKIDLLMESMDLPLLPQNW